MFSIDSLKTDSMGKFLVLLGISLMWLGYSEIKENNREIEKLYQIAQKNIDGESFDLFQSYYNDFEILNQLDSIHNQNERLKYLEIIFKDKKYVYDTLQPVNLIHRIAYIDTTTPQIKARIRFVIEKMDSLKPAMRRFKRELDMTGNSYLSSIKHLTSQNFYFRILIALGFIILGIGFFKWNVDDQKLLKK